MTAVYAEMLAGSIVVIDLHPDGTLRASNVERRYAVTLNGTPLQDRIERDVLTAETLAGVIASQAELLVRVTALTAERDAALAGKLAAEQARDAALAQVTALEAQLNPVDADGFPILSAVQVRLALLAAGITSAHVLGVINAIPDAVERERAMTFWDYSTELHRDHPMIAMFATALGLATAQVDTMWRAAAAIV